MSRLPIHVRRAIVLAMIGVGGFALTPPASAQKGGEEWILLAAHEVDRTHDKERIDLKATRGRVKAVRLIAKGAGIELTQVRVTYAGGQVHDEVRRINMNPNDRTRAIDESPQGRFVDGVELALRPVRPATGTPRMMSIEIWGLQSAAEARVERPLAPTIPAVVTTPAPPPASAETKPTAPAAAPPPLAKQPMDAPTERPQAAVASDAASQERSPASVVPAPVPNSAAHQLRSENASAATSAATLPGPTLPPAPSIASAQPTVRSQPASIGATSNPTTTVVPSPAPVVPPGVTPPLPPPRGANGRPEERLAMRQQGQPTARTGPPPTPPASEPAGDGVFLGRKTLDPTAQTENLPIGLENGRFSKIRLRALDAGVNVSTARLVYASGAHEDLKVDVDITANGRSRWLTVAGEQAIKEVAITYHRRDSGRTAATLEVYGTYAEGFLDPGGDGARAPRTNGWVALGAGTTAQRSGTDQLDFPIANNKGGFKKLRVDAKDRAITLREVRVVYGTGEDEIILIDSARQRIAAGASFGPIDLRGNTRFVKHVILKTRSRILESEARAKDAAIVEVWGQH